ncbi:MAG: YitT family protein [bacterium]
MELKNIKKYLEIVVGCFLIATSLNVFLSPNSFVLGGVTGLGIIIEEVCMNNFGIYFPVWLSNLVINTPMILVSLKLFGFNFVGTTMFAICLLSFCIKLTEGFTPFTDDILLAAVFGAIVDGIGIGIIIKNRSTTGGSDLLATIINYFVKHIPISKLMLIIDALIIMIGIVVFGVTQTLYAIISVYILNKVIGVVIDGVDFAKAVFIISDKSEEIGQVILSTVSRGATALDAHGMYTKNKKNVIFCVVQQKQIPELKEVVTSIDKDAFIVITNASEVIGSGFTSLVPTEKSKETKIARKLSKLNN